MLRKSDHLAREREKERNKRLGLLHNIVDKGDDKYCCSVYRNLRNTVTDINKWISGGASVLFVSLKTEKPMFEWRMVKKNEKKNTYILKGTGTFFSAMLCVFHFEFVNPLAITFLNE